jgi:hypothetical protein
MAHGARKKESCANEGTPGTKQTKLARTGNGSDAAKEDEENEGATVSVCSKLIPLLRNAYEYYIAVW